DGPHTSDGTTRRRVWLGLAVLLTIGAGLTAHRLGWGPAADACYTVMLYLLIALVWPRTRSLVVGAAAVALSTAVELFQLTPSPADLSSRFVLARLVLGTSFDAMDLLWYLLGGAVIATADGLIRRRRGAPSARADERG
ncbi:MAG: DUF2809 domain-containing protein, partial [Mycetocola sp.]